jgi:hypothetical protein
VTGFIDDVTATPTPRPTPIPVDTAPRITPPAEPYTNQSAIDLVVTVAPDIVGDPNRRLRVYLALEGQSPAPIQEVPISSTPQTVVPVELSPGINDFTVTLIGPGGETEASPLVRFVLDQEPPGIDLSSPKDGATINAPTVDIDGRTQARASLMARNTTTGESIGAAADPDGAFTLRLPIATGRNTITLTAIDPAGNANERTFNVDRGSGRLAVKLSANRYRIMRNDLPQDITLAATVDDPDGRPLAGASVTFTLSIPGIKTVTGDTTTDDDGTARFTTTIPAGASPGGGSAAVLVRTSEHGQATDDRPITVAK